MCCDVLRILDPLFEYDTFPSTPIYLADPIVAPAPRVPSPNLTPSPAANEEQEISHSTDEEEESDGDDVVVTIGEMPEPPTAPPALPTTPRNTKVGELAGRDTF